MIHSLSEAIEKMPDDAKMRLKEQNINLLQFIMNFIKDKKPEDENKNFEQYYCLLNLNELFDEIQKSY
jgi:hypothetical protein